MSKKCSKCGAILEDGDLFCDECGAGVDVSAPPAEVICAHCGAHSRAGDRFCKKCGSSLVETPQTSADVPPLSDETAQVPQKTSSMPMIIAAAVIVMALAIGGVAYFVYRADQTSAATKIINDLRAIKSAGLLAYMDEGQSWGWAVESNADRAAKMLGKYMDRPLFSGSDAPYSLHFAEAEVDGSKRILIGLSVKESILTDGVDKKLIETASRSGLYNRYGSYYDGRKSAFLDEPVFMILGDAPRERASSPRQSANIRPPQRTERERTPAETQQNSPRGPELVDPSRYRYVPCSGWVQADTKDGSLLNIRPAPGVIDPIVFQVPDSSKMHVDGWAWDEERGNDACWLRVVDHGGFVLGWVAYEFCDVSNVDFNGTRPYASNWTSVQTRRGSTVLRKRAPANYDARYATGHITVTAPNHDLNVRPAPGVVDDVVFIITDKNGCKVNGWSYDQFDRTADRRWLRLTDNHDNILGWVNAQLCNTQHVEFW